MNCHAALYKNDVILYVRKEKGTKDIFLNANNRASKQYIYYDPFMQVQNIYTYYKTKNWNDPHQSITLAREMKLGVKWGDWLCNEKIFNNPWFCWI